MPKINKLFTFVNDSFNAVDNSLEIWIMGDINEKYR
jgi:hypothetical protein